MGFLMSVGVEREDLQVVFSIMLHFSISLTLRGGSTMVGTFACELMRAVWGGSKDL